MKFGLQIAQMFRLIFLVFNERNDSSKERYPKRRSSLNDYNNLIPFVAHGRKFLHLRLSIRKAIHTSVARLGRAFIVQL